LKDKVKALETQIVRHEKSVLEYQMQESELQAEINELEENDEVNETKEQREALQL